MNIIKLILPFLLLFTLACKKDSEKPTEKEVPTDYNNFDLGIEFTHYESGKTYETDTLWNEFKITNYGPLEFKKGDLIQVATKIGGVNFSLDLIGEGPTPIELTEDLGINESFIFNPGYLLGSATQDYFGTDSLELCIMVYGVNDNYDDIFSKDTQASNNQSCIVYKDYNLWLK